MAETISATSPASGPAALVPAGDLASGPAASGGHGCRYPPIMPARATKRGGERTPLGGRRDVLICGGSFAGLAVARELAGSGADVLIVDRYEIGERQTSACGIPTDWLRATGLMDAELQRFAELVVHTAHGTTRYELPWTFS